MRGMIGILGKASVLNENCATRYIFIQTYIYISNKARAFPFPIHCVKQNLQDPWKFSCKILQDKALFLQTNARFMQEISVSCKNLERNFWFNEIHARYIWFLEHFYFLKKMTFL